MGELELKRIEDFSAYEAEWKKLPVNANPNSLFLSPLWERTWWDVFGSSRQLHILSVYDGENLIGIASLMEKDGKIDFVGDNDISDYLDLIMTPGKESAICHGLVDYLADVSWEKLELRNIPKNSPTLEILPALAREKGWEIGINEVETCPCSALPGTWDEFLASLDKKDRHELRRKIRRLEGHGNVQYYAVSDTANIEKDMDDFLRLHRLSQEEKAEFMTTEMEQFFRLAAERLIPAGLMRIYFMEVDGVRVSSVICFDQGNEVWLYNSGFDPSFGFLSVGLLLKALCLKDAIETGKSRFDFLRGKEPYKYDLGAKDMPIYSLTCSRRPAST